jgi:5-methylcytosine-specific restriction enzyme subunit McrC
LKRFGYNISNTEEKTIHTPPFWIDMSNLFELYVLGLLKDTYGKEVLYGKKEAGLTYGLPDYLITKFDSKCIADAKYKPLYNTSGKYDIENIRQLSGYARDKKVFDKLDTKPPEIIDCLLIYPLPISNKSSVEFKIDLELAEDLDPFVQFKKLGVPVPVIEK